jgi:hypothetical protein
VRKERKEKIEEEQYNVSLTHICNLVSNNPLVSSNSFLAIILTYVSKGVKCVIERENVKLLFVTDESHLFDLRF